MDKDLYIELLQNELKKERSLHQAASSMMYKFNEENRELRITNQAVYSSNEVLVSKLTDALNEVNRLDETLVELINCTWRFPK